MLDIVFGSAIGILSIVTVVFVTVMAVWMGIKFNQLSKQTLESDES